jgi:hypothetical protein
MSDKIPTAKEYVNDRALDDGSLNNEAAIPALIEFAKMHVKAALEAAAQHSITEESTDIQIMKILKAYPQSNIK